MARRQHGPLSLDQLYEGIQKAFVQANELRASGSILLENHPRTAFPILATAFEELGKIEFMAAVMRYVGVKQISIEDPRKKKTIKVDVWGEFWCRFYNHRSKIYFALKGLYANRYYKGGSESLKEVVSLSDSPLDAQDVKEGMLYIDFRDGQWVVPEVYPEQYGSQLLERLDEQLKLWQELLDDPNAKDILQQAAQQPIEDSNAFQNEMFAAFDKIVIEKSVKNE